MLKPQRYVCTSPTAKFTTRQAPSEGSKPLRRSSRIAAMASTKPSHPTPSAITIDETKEDASESGPLVALSSDLTSLSDQSSSLSDLTPSEDDKQSPQAFPHKPSKKRKKHRNLTPHQRQRRNAYSNSRRKKKRVKNSVTGFTSAPLPPGGQIIQRHVIPIDLFPAITQDFRQWISEYKRLAAEYNKNKKDLRPPPKVFARNPTDIENKLALETVNKTFQIINSNYNKIYEKRTNELVAIVEFIPLSDLSKAEWDDFEFLCVFLHECKEFISPVASKSRKCGGFMWMIGWRKGYDGLEILGRYRDQNAIDNNPDGFRNLMEKSARAGEILWKIFYSFGNVAVKNNQAYMNRFNIPSISDINFPKIPGDKSPFGFASSLAFSSHGFYNHHHKDGGDLSDLPLAFALMIPTSKITGRIATKANGYDVKNGHFIFRDLQLALDFKPDTICRMIFRAREYVHATLLPIEPSDYTKLGMSLQVATKASNACKNYIDGKYDEEPDKYFGDVDELLNT